jgi:hypothetical protein
LKHPAVFVECGFLEIQVVCNAITKREPWAGVPVCPKPLGEIVEPTHFGADLKNPTRSS